MTTQELALAIIEYVTVRTTLAWIMLDPRKCGDHPRNTITELTAQEIARTIHTIIMQSAREAMPMPSVCNIVRNANGDGFYGSVLIRALDECKYSEKEIKKMCDYLAIATARAKCAIANIRGMHEFDDRARSYATH